MTKASLSLKYTGPLKIIIHTLDGQTYESQLNWMYGGTLFEQLGHACALLFTNLTTKPQVTIRFKNWRLIRFNPNEQVLEVEQIGGETLKIEPDDPVRLAHLHTDDLL